METKKILDLIAFFNDITIEEEDVTTPEEREDGQLVLVVTYHYKEQTFTTQSLYYRDVATADSVRDIRFIEQHFGKPVYWLDDDKHPWPQPSGKSDLNHLVIDQIAQPGDDAFKEFLLLLGNNGKTGEIQQFTRDGERGQYHHNLMNNNHWHDLVTMIKAYIDSGGKDIDEKYFSRLIFMWQDGERATLSRFIGDRKIMDMLQENIQKVQPQLMNKEITDLLLQKKQIILQGPPGTGKTRYAQILAAELTEDNIHIKEEDVKSLIPAGHILKTKEKYEFEVSGVDTSIRIVIKSTGKAHTVPIKNVVNYASTRSFEDQELNHNSGYAPYEIALAKYIIQVISQKNIKLVQFHPSYSYEDFVRGISAKPVDGTVEYRTQNRLLGDFAKAALDNYLDSRKDAEYISKEKKLADLFEDFKDSIQDILDEDGRYMISKAAHIYAADEDGFKYTGDKWGSKFKIPYSEIMKLYNLNITERKQIKKQPSVAGSARQHATYYFRILEKFREFIKAFDLTPKITQKVKEEKYVMIIDEINRANLASVLGELIYALEYRGKPVESMYDIDGDRTIIIPANLYIIGTMNTADRSVGHIDYAIRRRFAFVDIGPDFGAVKTNGSTGAQNLFKSVAKLFWVEYKEDPNTKMERSVYLASDFKPEDVMIGHSYFLEKDNAKLKNRLKYEIKPILREYVKDGILNNDAEAEIEKLSV